MLHRRTFTNPPSMLEDTHHGCVRGRVLRLDLETIEIDIIECHLHVQKDLVPASVS